MGTVKRYRAGILMPTETQTYKGNEDGSCRLMPLLWSDSPPTMQVESEESNVRLFVICDGQEHAILDKNPIGFK